MVVVVVDGCCVWGGSVCMGEKVDAWFECSGCGCKEWDGIDIVVVVSCLEWIGSG